jgi:GxxExxY protein
LLEAVYQKCLGWELRTRNVPVEQNVLLPLSYKGMRLGTGLRIDLLVDHAVIIEVKSVASLQPIHEAQLLTYMKLAGMRKGLLINFNVPVLKEGVRRFVL